MLSLRQARILRPEQALAMQRFGPDTATIDVFVDKEGVFAAAGHDLQLRATRFTVEVDAAAERVHASLDARCLVVVHALRDGVPQPSALDAKDRTRIESSIRDDVLHAETDPVIEFRATRLHPIDGGFRLDGHLTLAGTTRPLAFDARRDGADLVATVELDQPAWGIKPFSAVLGTLRVKRIVRVAIRVPAAT